MAAPLLTRDRTKVVDSRRNLKYFPVGRRKYRTTYGRTRQRELERGHGPSLKRGAADGGCRRELFGRRSRSSRARRRARGALSWPPPPPRRRRRPSASCIYTGTTGYRHADAIDTGRPAVQTALEGLGYTSTGRTATTTAAARTTATTPNKNPRIFTDANLANYDAILLLNTSASGPAAGARPALDQAQRDAIIRFVQKGGGIAANHNATDMGAGIVSWDWWDGGNDSAVGTLMKGHGATNQNNVAPGPGRRPQPPLDARTARHGTASATSTTTSRAASAARTTCSRRSTSAPTRRGNPMGQDHPISWCKLYDGDSVDDGTGDAEGVQRRPRLDDRHGPLRHRLHGQGDSEIVKHIVGGIRWAAGEGRKSDCSGTVWSNFTRTTLVNNVNGPIGLDVAPDGKVFWTEIGPVQGYQSEGYLKMYDPTGPAEQQDDGRHDPDPRRPRQLRGRRARHDARERLRPQRSDQARRLHLLLAAQPRVADHRATRSSWATTRSAASRSTRRARRSSRTPSA